jgi:hypothetical protein
MVTPARDERLTTEIQRHGGAQRKDEGGRLQAEKPLARGKSEDV